MKWPDVLWVLICLANQNRFDAYRCVAKNFEKKDVRDAERHQNNEKLKRQHYEE